MSLDDLLGAGTALNPYYYDGPAEKHGDVGWVAGKCFNVQFMIERPAKDVWLHLKDFDPWQNSYGLDYSGAVGDLEDRNFFISDKPSDPDPPKSPLWQYQMLRVIPEYTIVLSQPVSEDGRSGGISPGFHVFTLDEHASETVVTVLMEHASRHKGMTEEEGPAPWRKLVPESQMKLRDIFIPTLKRLVYEGR